MSENETVVERDKVDQAQGDQAAQAAAQAVNNGLEEARAGQAPPASQDANGAAVAKEFHPIADAFPLITGVRLHELVEDIRRAGLVEPIVLFEGKVLDGRNRYNACRATKVAPRFVEFHGDEEAAIAFVTSKNLRRRDLTDKQRAAAALKLKDFASEAAKRRQLAGLKQSRQEATADQDGAKGKTLAVLAEQAGVSPALLERADEIKRKQPDAYDQMMSDPKATIGATHDKLKKDGKLPSKRKPDAQIVDAVLLTREQAIAKRTEKYEKMYPHGRMLSEGRRLCFKASDGTIEARVITYVNQAPEHEVFSEKFTRADVQMMLTALGPEVSA